MKQNVVNLDYAAGNFNMGLPAEWTTSFDLVWSQEAFCHAKSQINLLKEIKRVLKPGGAAVFTDIMRMVRLYVITRSSHILYSSAEY